MARVTVEDCVDKVPNRFELVLLAAHRARAVSSGAAPTALEGDNDKSSVVALREIAEKTVSPQHLKEDLIHSLQTHVDVDKPEPEAAPALPASILGPDDQSSDVKIDRITEDELLEGLARSIAANAAPKAEKLLEGQVRLPLPAA